MERGSWGSILGRSLLLAVGVPGNRNKVGVNAVAVSRRQNAFPRRHSGVLENTPEDNLAERLVRFRSHAPQVGRLRTGLVHVADGAALGEKRPALLHGIGRSRLRRRLRNRLDRWKRRRNRSFAAIEFKDEDAALVAALVCGVFRMHV